MTAVLLAFGVLFTQPTLEAYQYPVSSMVVADIARYRGRRVRQNEVLV